MAQDLKIDREHLLGILNDAVRELEVEVSSDALDKCIRHVELLNQWNQIQNLTAIRDPVEMVIKHVLDSLSVLSFVDGVNALDMGTGAGFPGLTLALAQPARNWLLLDAGLKKIQFVRHVIAEVGIGNAQAVHERMQNYKPKVEFDTIVCRALGSLSAVTALGIPLLRSGGRLLAMKGQYPHGELSELQSSTEIEVHELHPPQLNESRHLVVLRKNQQ